MEALAATVQAHEEKHHAELTRRRDEAAAEQLRRIGAASLADELGRATVVSQLATLRLRTGDTDAESAARKSAAAMMKAANGVRELSDAGPEAPIVAKLVEIVAEYDRALQAWLDSGRADEAASKALDRASQRIGMTASITSRAQHDHRRTTQAAITAATDAL